MGETPSKVMSSMAAARKAKTTIQEVSWNGAVVKEAREVLAVATYYSRSMLKEKVEIPNEQWEFDPRRVLPEKSRRQLSMAWTEEEVRLAVKGLAKGKSPGQDGLPKELFEWNRDLLGGKLLDFTREFELSAKLPKSLVTSVTILLHKKGDKSKLDNYIPITLLSAVYKIIAEVLANRIRKVIHHVISKDQYGFVPGRKLRM
ncbi:unnamed protein product [Closterium sp. NIES-53]